MAIEMSLNAPEMVRMTCDDAKLTNAKNGRVSVTVTRSSLAVEVQNLESRNETKVKTYEERVRWVAGALPKGFLPWSPTFWKISKIHEQVCLCSKLVIDMDTLDIQKRERKEITEKTKKWRMCVVEEAEEAEEEEEVV